MVGVSSSAVGQIVRENIDELRNIDVVEHLGESIDQSLQFVNSRNETVTLGDHFDGEHPVILVMGYYECPMLCNLVFNGMIDGLHQLEWTAGQEFKIVTVSIDPGETPQLAMAKQENYINALSREVPVGGWEFLVADTAQSTALAEQLGFVYWYDEERDEYAHPAVIFVMTPDGVISRYLYGIEFKERDLRLSLLEASQGKIGSTIDRIILYCFHYDPDAKGYVVFAGNVMRLGGLFTLVVLAVFVAMLFRRERQRRRAAIQDLSRTSVHRA
jgi:protein SCO1/2